MKPVRLSTVLVVASLLSVTANVSLAQPPSSYDLRNVGGVNYVTSVKYQQGGTCWTHGTMAAIEGNLLMTGAWAANGESGEPNLAEYHLDWWNGFNQYNNDDIVPPSGSGLVVHEGGDYRVSFAYLTRGEGAVRDIDGQSYSTAPLRWNPSYHRYYPRDIEWYSAGPFLGNINLIKTKIMTYGVMGTCMAYDASFMSGSYTHYQPPTSTMLPNHAVSIIGWDNSKVTQAPNPGAWLVKNSWGTSWGLVGFFWISYYDKWSCQEPQMGAVSMQNVEPMAYDRVYYHDYHGWRDTMTGVTEAFNAFTAADNEVLAAVSFFTAANGVTYTVRVYGTFSGGELLNELSSKTGPIAYTGFHTIDLDTPVSIATGSPFYIYLQLSSGGQPYDRTSDVPVLLGASYRTIVASSASPGESYYMGGAHWQDLYDYSFTDPTWNHTANFCIKGLAVEYRPLSILLPDGPPDLLAPGIPTAFHVQIDNEMENYVPGTAQLHCRYDGGTFLSLPLAGLGGDLFQAVLPPAHCGDTPEYYISAQSDGGATVLSPAGAPATVYTAQVGTLTVVMADNFEANHGWTAENLGATSGDWQRGVPVNDPDWDYDPISDSDGSGQCYLTQNQLGNTDVDSGAVRLKSPIIDMTGGATTISYDYYLYLTDTTGGVDKLLVEINNAGGSGLWTEIARHITDGGLAWRSNSIDQAALNAAGVVLTNQMQLRFTANDADPQSIVEAGLDAFLVQRVTCVEPTVCAGDCNCDGAVNWRDIDFFVAAMNDNSVAWLAMFGPDAPTCPFWNNDVNADGTVNWRDIDPLVGVMNTACP